MKTCHACGCEVEDRELICPDCGATVVKHSGTLSIKSVEDTKKKLNPMGMTVSTGSGLTDILRNESEFDDVDDEYFGGSMPAGLAKTIIEDDGRKKSDTKKVFASVIKILLFAAAAFGVYWLVVNVFLKRDNVATYEEAVEIYVQAVNDADAEKMLKIIPSYLNDPSAPAEKILEELQNVEITRYDIIAADLLTVQEVAILQEEIKLSTAKTANIQAAYNLRIRFYGTTLNASGQTVEKNGEVELKFIKVKDNWLLETESYKAPDIK